ncbi:MAG TPA: 4-aminobutyrate--2-oxoglutarate transaminase [Jatrophihabitans sp.]|jgi:4-aminobutyrate aminotransferase/(S)-3-amino-2-methylpropionate transaminase
MTVEQNRVLHTSIPGPRSQELQARKTAAVASGVGTTLPIYVTAAGGGIVVDVDGNQLIDFGSGIAVTTVGNAAPRVVDAVQQQVAAFTHTCFMITPYEGYVAVAEKLNEVTPGTFEKRSALFNSGAEAVENAVKIARHATGRQAVVVFDHAYHGRTNLTMALTAKNMPYKHRFGPFAGEVYRVPMAYPFRWPTGPDNCADEAFEQFVSLVHTQVGESNCAAVLVEPIQGEGGFIVPAPGFLAKVAEWCLENDILLIADEIQSGFCRTGDWFACENEGVVPDLITTAKGIAGGMPLAAVTGRADVMDAVHTGGLGGTYGGNPVACAAALAAIETMQAENLAGAARRIEQTMRVRLEALAGKYDVIGDVRGRGAMLAVELVEPGTAQTSKAPNPALTSAISAACHQQGLITLTAGTFGNVLRFLPPLVIGDDLLLEGLDILDAAFAATA